MADESQDWLSRRLGLPASKAKAEPPPSSDEAEAPGPIDPDDARPLPELDAWPPRVLARLRPADEDELADPVSRADAADEAERGAEDDAAAELQGLARPVSPEPPMPPPDPEVADGPIQLPLRATWTSPPPSPEPPPPPPVPVPGADLLPPRPRSPTARHWSRPHWQDVADAAEGRPFDSAVADHRPHPDAPRPWDPDSAAAGLQPRAPRAAGVETSVLRRGERGRIAFRRDELPEAGVVQSPLPGCPFLGLAEDRATHFTFTHEEHLCFALGRPTTIDASFQLSHCLGVDFPACDRFRTAGIAPGHPGVPEDVDSPVAGSAMHVVRGAVSQLRAFVRDGQPPDRRSVRIGLAIAAGLGLVAVLLGMLGMSGSGLLPAGAGDPSRSPEASQAAVLTTPSTPGAFLTLPPRITPPPTPSPTLAPTPSAPPTPAPATAAPTPSPRPTAPATTEPTAAPTPTAVPTRRPTATPRPTPTPAPTHRTYVVQTGDTLSRIAQRFGTTVDAIMRLNGLREASLIRPGQRLLIP